MSAPLTINIVYSHLKEDSLTPVPLEGRASILWTKAPLPQSDVIVYYNSYSYNSKRDRDLKYRLKTIYLSEPIVVHPPQYDATLWKQFDVLFTWCEYLWKSGGRFVYAPTLMYDFPYGEHRHDYKPSEDTSLLTKPRRNAICAIYNDKRSLIPCELYTLRRNIPAWFEENSDIPFDLYGMTPFNLPNYRGPAGHKIELLSEYRFSLVFQNTYDEKWSAGYFTDELIDCFAALTIPIYYGCYNPQDYFPEDCIIDYRQFSSLRDLERRLKAIGDEEHQSRIHSIRDFINTYDPVAKHSCLTFYKIAEQTARDILKARIDISRRKDQEFPADYLQSARTFREKWGFYVSCLLLKSRFVANLALRTLRRAERILKRVTGK